LLNIYVADDAPLRTSETYVLFFLEQIDAGRASLVSSALAHRAVAATALQRLRRQG